MTKRTKADLEHIVRTAQDQYAMLEFKYSNLDTTYEALVTRNNTVMRELGETKRALDQTENMRAKLSKDVDTWRTYGEKQAHSLRLAIALIHELSEPTFNAVNYDLRNQDDE